MVKLRVMLPNNDMKMDGQYPAVLGYLANLLSFA